MPPVNFLVNFSLGGRCPPDPPVFGWGGKAPPDPPLNGRSSHLIEAAKRGRLDQMIFFSAPLTTRAPPGRPAGRPAERPAGRPAARPADRSAGRTPGQTSGRTPGRTTPERPPAPLNLLGLTSNVWTPKTNCWTSIFHPNNKNFKRPKNCEDGSNFDDFRTKKIAATQAVS